MKRGINLNILSVENITHSFTERKLFDKASFYLHEGDKVGVIGINGTGKSTLLKIRKNQQTSLKDRKRKTRRVQRLQYPERNLISIFLKIIQRRKWRT